VNACEDNDIGIGLGCLLAQAEAVADVIGDILNLRFLVVVGQDDSIAFFFQLVDLGCEVEGGVYVEVEVAHFSQVAGGEVKFGGHRFYF